MAASAARIAEVLASLRNSSARLGADVAEVAHLPFGVVTVDAALSGGLVRGRVTELYGPRSSGRLSTALGALAATQARGELVALVDVADALDPRSAAAGGIDLTRLLWVRPRTFKQGLQAADRVLDAGGFGLVVLYLCGVATASGPRPRPGVDPSSPWTRLARRAERARSAVLVVADRPTVGSFAVVAMETRPTRSRWLGEGCAPRVLDGVTGRVAVVRNKLGPPTGDLPLLLDVVPR